MKIPTVIRIKTWVKIPATAPQRLASLLQVLLILLAFAAVAQAQDTFSRVELIPSPAYVVKQGKPTVITLRFRVLKGFHINSAKPLSELLMATTLKLDPPQDLTLGKFKFPEGQLLSFPFSPEDKLSVYSGDFDVKVTVYTSRHTTVGANRVRGTLAYQACNDRQCFAPKSLPVNFDVKVLRSR